MGNQVVSFTARWIYYTINFPTSSDLAGNFEVEGDGTIYFYSSTNVASYTFNNSTLPTSVVNKTRYTFSIIKSVAGQTAQLVLRKRRTNTKTNTINITSMPSEESQGTYAVFLHNLDSKITVYDLSNKVNDSNYLGVNSWTNDPKTVLNLPVITGYWNTGFVDYANGVLYLFGNNVGSKILYICKYYFSGAKSGQIWDLDDLSQNSFSSITLYNAWYSSSLHVSFDYATLGVILVDANYNLLVSNVLNLKSWTPIYSNATKFLPFSNPDYNMRKTSYRFDISKWCFESSFQDMTDYVKTYNHDIPLYNTAAAFDNVSGYTYKAFGQGGTLQITSDNTPVNQTFIGTAAVFSATLIITASARRSMLVTKLGAYIDYPKRVSLYNLSALTVANELIFTDTNVTNCKDADYCNSIDKWVCLSDGTAGTTQGRRTVYFLKPVSDGGTFLKYKDTLSYDSNYLFVNRLRY